MTVWNKGLRLSKEHCQKLSLSHKGQVAWNKGLGEIRICIICGKNYRVHNKHSKLCSVGCRSRFMSGKPSGMLGKPQTERQKKVVALINSVLQQGENNSNWRGGQRTNKPREYLRQWRKNNPLSVKASNHKRREFTKNLSVDTVQKVYERNILKHGTLTCYLCLNSIPFGKDHLEHKIPLSRGGTNSYENLAVACQQCNCRKHQKTQAEFMHGGVTSNSNS